MDSIQKALIKVGRKDLAQEYYTKVAARKNPDDWKKNFIVIGDSVSMAIEVVAAENDGWRAEVGFSKGGMVIEDPVFILKSEWAKSFEAAETIAKSMARKYKIKWQPKPYGKH